MLSLSSRHGEALWANRPVCLPAALKKKKKKQKSKRCHLLHRHVCTRTHTHILGVITVRRPFKRPLLMLINLINWINSNLRVAFFNSSSYYYFYLFVRTRVRPCEDHRVGRAHSLAPTLVMFPDESWRSLRVLTGTSHSNNPGPR